MADRELLYFSAKAAGLKTGDWLPGSFGLMLYEGITGTKTKRRWNPLTDDGDALRLAVSLRIEIEPWIHGDSDCARAAVGEILIDVQHCGAGPCRATRHAIVRAAAEIGRLLGDA